MARIAGVDLPRNKRIEIGLTYIYGMGRSSSQKILKQLNIDPNLKTDDLTEVPDQQHPQGPRQRPQGGGGTAFGDLHEH